MAQAVAVESGPAGEVDPAELGRWSEALTGRPAAEVLALAAERWPAIRFGTGFGPEGCALVDLIARHRLPIEIFTLDTGLLFPETYELWRRLQDELAALQPGSTHVIATRSGHDIQHEQPELVLAQVRRVVAAVRTS